MPAHSEDIWVPNLFHLDPGTRECMAGTVSLGAVILRLWVVEQGLAQGLAVDDAPRRFDVVEGFFAIRVESGMSVC